VNGVDMELGYEGSRNSLEGGGNGALWRHNVGLLAKVGPVIEDFRPFVGAGFGVGLLNPDDEASGVLGNDTDVITEVPLAAGIEYKIGEVTAGARATYRLLGDEELAGADQGNLFTAGISLGGRF
jgi:hypothetical protein